MHGRIIAEAYRIPFEWIKLSDKVLGNGFKFEDYLSATDRDSFRQTFNLIYQQDKLLKAFEEHYAITGD